MLNDQKSDSLVFKNFIDLDEHESQRILDIRNDEDVRKWMNNDSIISLENHINYIEKLKIDKSKCYVVMLKDNDIIGSIYLVDIVPNESAVFGFYTNPKYFKTNFGIQVFYFGLSYFIKQFSLKKITGSYFKDNHAAALLNLSLGYKISGYSVMNNRESVEIELITSDWEFGLSLKEIFNRIILFKKRSL